MTTIAPTLQAFFTDRLMSAAPRCNQHTLASYRDTIRLLLGCAPAAHRQEPARPGLH